MAWIEKVWGQLVAGEPTLVAAVLGVAGAVIAGVLGGWLGGRLSAKAALRGAEKAHKDSLERENRAMEQQVIGFVQALQAEVDGLLVSFEAEIAPTIRAAKTEDGVTVFFPIGRDYFIVYPANASMLGHIDDLQLRKRIVKMYIAMKGMIDTIHMNNRYLDEFNRVRDLSIEGGPVAMVAAKLDTRAAKAELVQYSEGMKGALGTVMSEIDGFYEASNAWLIGRGMQPTPPPQFIRPQGIGSAM